MQQTFTRHSVLLMAILTLSPAVLAQWVNHYPKLEDFGHHVYLEQHELPILAHGITDPAPAPDGKTLAFASKGWIWRLELQSGIAKRLTNTASVDSRPRWSPDGKHLAFVRDFGDDTAVVLKNIASGKETLINSEQIDLDPEFSADGDYLFYTSGATGSLNLYQRHIESGSQQQITSLRQVERNARRTAGDNSLLYLHGNGAQRVLRHRDLLAGTDEVVHAETLTYHLTADAHPTRDLIVYSAPIDNDYHLWTKDLSQKQVAHRLTDGTSFALTPAFSADGNHIYFVELAENRQFQLMRIATYGGATSQVNVTQWDYGSATGTLDISIINAQQQPISARLSIVAGDGHPVTAVSDATYIDPQTGRAYFYVDGSTQLILPVGKYRVLAARGPITPMSNIEVSVKKAKTTTAKISLNPIWDSAAQGYVSADYHVHLNGDGHHRASHADALRLIRGEGLNQLAPMSWNRWERRIDNDILGKHSKQGMYEVMQGQEVRSHFHGHIGLQNVSKPFAPWFFGPKNPVLGDPDLTNGDVFAFANKVGAFATYVHPLDSDMDPFSDAEIDNIPLELVSDGVLEEKMGLELVCAWTSPLGNSALWYRLLNIGRPIAAMSGTDGWVDFHRTPAMGTGRAYIRPLETVAGEHNGDPVLAGAIAGRSFVTTGPVIIFSLDNGAKPGDITENGKQTWELTLASTVDVDRVEIILNGQVVQTLDGLAGAQTRSYNGQLDLPQGGWVAARAYATEPRVDNWPSMHARPFAHSSPIWIGQVGSTNTVARATAAADLIRAINTAEQRARDAYGDRPMPRLYQRFEQARIRLRSML